MFISVEQTGNGLEFYGDTEGRDYLIRQLESLEATGDYCFMVLGAELDRSSFMTGSSQVEYAGVRLVQQGREVISEIRQEPLSFD